MISGMCLLSEHAGVQIYISTVCCFSSNPRGSDHEHSHTNRWIRFVISLIPVGRVHLSLCSTKRLLQKCNNLCVLCHLRRSLSEFVCFCWFLLGCCTTIRSFSTSPRWHDTQSHMKMFSFSQTGPDCPTWLRRTSCRLFDSSCFPCRLL